MLLKWVIWVWCWSLYVVFNDIFPIYFCKWFVGILIVWFFFSGYGIMRKPPSWIVLIIMISQRREFLNSVFWMSLMTACCLLLHVIFFPPFFFNVSWCFLFCKINLGLFSCRWWKYPDLERLYPEGQSETRYYIFFNPRSQTWCAEFECCCGLAAAVWISCMHLF